MTPARETVRRCATCGRHDKELPVGVGLEPEVTIGGRVEEWLCTTCRARRRGVR